MEIKQSAQAGTLESSDIMILIEPTEGNLGRNIELDSPVMLQYGNSIKDEIGKVLDKFEVENIHLIAKDKGALTPTISARVETALKRAAGIQEGTL